MQAAKIDAVFQAARKLHEQGRLAEAERLYLAVLKARPRDVKTLQWAGLAALRSGLAELAVQRLEAAVALAPKATGPRIDLGRALRQLGRRQEALAQYDTVIALNPADAMVWTNRGAVLRELGRTEDSLESLARALSLNPDISEAWHTRGKIFHQLSRFDEAIESYDKAVFFNISYSDAWNDRGVALNICKRRSEAVASFDRALALRPAFFEAWSNRGIALTDIGQPEDALRSLDQALALRPTVAGAWYNRGRALHNLARFYEAVVSYDRAIALQPDYAQACFNRSMTLLLLGDFARGWVGYEHRKLADQPIADRAYPQPLWSGAQAPQGKAVLIHAEQGLGDTLQFCRYVPVLEALGLKVLFAPQVPLCALMQTLSPTLEIVDADDPALRFDHHSPLMSLPLSFSTRLETIPAKTPYLAAEPERVARWRKRIGGEGFRVGVCWRGSQSSYERAAFPLASLGPLAATPGVRLISLHKGDGEAELAQHPELGIEQLEGLDTFLDTAAAMEALDLIITCDTAVAHLAGALARPTWVALSHVPDWRWLLGRTDSPWYPGMRLFRQQTRGDWDGVFAEIETALRQQLK